MLALRAFADVPSGPALVAGSQGEATAASIDALARALSSDDDLHDDLDEALGAVHESAHFTLSEDGIRAVLASERRSARDHEDTELGDIAVALHWSESFAESAARVLRAAIGARCVLILTDPNLPQLGLALAAGLVAAGVDPQRVAVLHDDGLDVLRSLAAEPELALDVVRPDAFATGLAGSLKALREAAVSDRSERVPGADWFGHGVVARPAAPLNVRLPSGVNLVIGDAGLGDLPGTVRLPADDLEEAAEEVVERAFGRGVLGGHAAGAVCRVFIERHAFSRFTECLLTVLDDADSDPWFDPPAWAFSAEGRSERSLFTARRSGLDEGGTLIHERRRKGRKDGGRRRGSGEAHGLVFTNVEERMRLGGSLRVAGVLALVRGGR